MKLNKKNKETGSEPVSFKEKENKIYQKGMRRGILVSTSVILIAGLAACGININIGKGASASSSSEEKKVSSLEKKVNSSETETASGSASLNTVLDEESLTKMQTLINALNNYYYEGVSADAMQEGLYKGLIESTGDPYTEYYTAEEYQNLQNSTNGSYSGIGALLAKDVSSGYPVISHIYDDSPAEKAGLQEGDLIYKVNGTTLSSDMDISKVASMIKGEEGTKVTLTLIRDSKEVEEELTRAKVEISTVAYKMLDDKIGYIEIAEFSKNTEEQFSDAVSDLEEQGMEKVIIDLRNNGGGVVDGCAAIMDDVLPKGLTLYMEDKKGGRQEFESDDEKQIDMPLVVLVNGNSASASEIFTAAIKDFEWGTIIGTTTYGKGVFQSVIPLDDGSALKITVGKFYSPKGNNYNGVGIEPDIELEYENTAGEDAEYSIDTDNQIQKAIEVLNSEQ